MDWTVLLYGLKTWCGIQSMQALPPVLLSDAALMPLVGVNARHGRQGGCQRGATQRQRERTPGPISPETWANTIVTLNVRDLARVCNGASRALAPAGVFDQKVTGIADGTDRESTARSQGCGQGHAIEVTGYGWNVRRLIDARPTIPLAVKVGLIQEHEPHWSRALVTQARANLAGHARLHTVVFARGCWDGPDLWWLDQQGLPVVVPANSQMAVTTDARAPAAAGEEGPVGRRAPGAGEHSPHRTAGDRGGRDHSVDPR
jgi:hypothetical protein